MPEQANPAQSRLRLHIGPPVPGPTDTTFCGRPLADVEFWATSDVATHMKFAKVCAVCTQSLARRERDFIAEVGRV
jgi:hypothetical protein